MKEGKFNIYKNNVLIGEKVTFPLNQIYNLKKKYPQVKIKRIK